MSGMQLQPVQSAGAAPAAFDELDSLELESFLHGKGSLRFEKCARPITGETTAGYLSVSRGDVIRVLYIGSLPDEVGWLYARRQEDGVQGWLPCDALDSDSTNRSRVPCLNPPLPEKEDGDNCSPRKETRSSSSLPVVCGESNAGDHLAEVVEVLQTWSSDGQGGYLDLSIGDRVRILYIGCGGNECGWVYGALPDGRAGWFPGSAAPPPAREPLRELASDERAGEGPLQVNAAADRQELGSLQSSAAAPDREPLAAQASGSRDAIVIDVRVHRRIQSNPGANSNLRRKPETAERPLEDPATVARRQVRHGEQIDVLEDAGDWVLVRKQGTATEEGWLQAIHLHPLDGRPVKSDKTHPPAVRAPSRPCPRPQEEPRKEPPLPPQPVQLTRALPPPPPVPPQSSPPRSSQARLIHIYTFGLENYHPELTHHVRGFEGYDYGASVDDELLRRIFVEREKKGIDVFSDVRLFCDPSSRGHIGVHPEILKTMASNRHFPGWLGDLRKEVFRAFQKSWEIHVAFYCRSGKHRSVAGARFLEHCAKTEGWMCCQNHLCRDRWRHTCRGLCAECNEQFPNRARDEALQRAWGFWQRCV